MWSDTFVSTLRLSGIGREGRCLFSGYLPIGA
jgi:hypothetical protein